MTYRIVRFYKNEGKVILSDVEEGFDGLTLVEAQAHCHRKDTKGNDWFDGYEIEEYGD